MTRAKSREKKRAEKRRAEEEAKERSSQKKRQVQSGEDEVEEEGGMADDDDEGSMEVSTEENKSSRNRKAVSAVICATRLLSFLTQKTAIRHSRISVRLISLLSSILRFLDSCKQFVHPLTAKITDMTAKYIPKWKNLILIIS